MIEGQALGAVTVASRWSARLGPGCELIVTLSSGRELWIVRTELASVDDEVAAWEERRGRRVARTKEISSWPLAPAGRQVTLDITLEDGFRFEGDLIEVPADVEPAADLETEWTFEGVPGEEMGKAMERRSR